jgi:tetratricopeptide (TPR) repeat protein
MNRGAWKVLVPGVFPARLARHTLLVLIVLFVLVTPSAIYSCGPFLETAVFAFRDQPDGPAANFAAGKLGIVRPGFRRSYLVIAYRYLSGLALTATQQKAAIAVWDRDAVPEHPPEEESAASWAKARGTVPDLPPEPNTSPFAPVSKDQPYFQYVNCPSDAFLTAVKTLDQRSATFGIKTAAVRDWVTAQDQVFVNCSGDTHIIPAALNAGDTLQRADRAYQIASANFYAGDFDEAVRDFDAIAQDPNSPWAAISPYLAARALIRKATLAHGQNDAFDATAMADAQKRLQEIVNDPKENSIHTPARKLLNFVLFRTEPEQRASELGQVMVAADPGPNFKQDLWDYVLLLSQDKQGGALGDWVTTFASLADNAANGGQQMETTQHAIDTWHKTQALPWLIAALRGTHASSAELSSLLSDVRKVPESSPAYLTVRYYSISLEAAFGQTEAARKELDELLRKISPDAPAGSYNLLNDMRQTLTVSLDDFLQHAAERSVGADEGPGTDEQIDNPDTNKDIKLLNFYTAKVFQKRLPLPMLEESAQSTILPKNIRRDLVRSSWVRAILLNDLSAAMQLQATIQQLDPPLWKAMEPFRSASNDAARHFAGIFIILQNPGLKPSAREGLPRTATLGEIDNYRDNWWCATINGGANWSEDGSISTVGAAQNRDAKVPFPVWLSSSQKAASEAEWEKLAATGTAPNYLAQQALARAKQDPEDMLVPQALSLVVRATRFGCTDSETSALSKSAFEFLHKHYPESEWAAKTKYYY